jgi:beta-phosphoglucomutase
MDAILFDFNGVLVDDEHLHQQCFTDVLVARGHAAVSEALYNERYLGFDDRGAFGAMLADAGVPTNDALINELIAEKAVMYERRAQTELRLFDAAADAVRAAATAGPVVVVSGALRAEIELGLAALGVRASVAHIVAAEDVLRCKPDPEGYLLALGWLRARGHDVDAARCVAVEDSLAGIAAARAAGMKVIGVAQSHPPEALRDAGADLVLTSVAELRAAHIVALGSRGEVR